MNKIIMFTFLILAFATFCGANQMTQDNLENCKIRMYVNPSDLLISDDGLYLIGISKELIPLCKIGTDEYGFYIEAAKDRKIDPKKEPTCVNGHPVYHSCGGCANWWCNSRCKCYSPWN